MATVGSSLLDQSEASGFRIVLLGWRSCGKSVAANTIFGYEGFEAGTPTASSVKSQGEVAGRQITIVDTPGWWTYSFDYRKSVEQVTDQLVDAVALCSPGPHVFLLVIPVNVTFTEEHRKAWERHHMLLGNKAWSHSFVLFFLGYWLGGKSIEEHIESQGSALKWLVEKCGNRYHVLNNKDSLTKVTALLEKIEKMVTANGNHYFVMDRKVQEQVETRRKEVEQRAKKRKTDMDSKRESLRQEYTEESRHLSEVRIVLLGPRRSRKSSAGNTILGNEEFETDKRTAQCVVRQGRVFGRQVTIVDTPGWWRDHEIQKTPELDKREIRQSISLCPPGPHVILLVVNTSASFTDSYRKIMMQYLRLIGDGLWSHTMILFTMGDFLGGKSIEQHIESDDIGLQRLVDESGNRYHVLNNMDNGDITQVKELLEKIEEMVALNGGRSLGMDGTVLREVGDWKLEIQEKATERFLRYDIQRETLRNICKAEGHYVSEFRIVMVGYCSPAKTSAGKNILGVKVFASQDGNTKCLIAQSDLGGRNIKVVSTPSWASNSFKQCPPWLKRELERSVSLCSPGPHVFLIVLRADTAFTAENKTSVEGHMRIFGDHVWKHSMVLFTQGDWLGDTSIEQCIESGGRALQWLVEKCGNRYHVLNDESKSAAIQIPELLMKIEEMVAGLGGQHFILDKHEETQEERAREMQIKSMVEQEWDRRKGAKDANKSTEIQKLPVSESTIGASGSNLSASGFSSLSIPQSLLSMDEAPSELRVLLLGGRASGKSSSGNTLLGQEAFDTQTAVKECVKKQGKVAERKIIVVDTPGWWKYTAQNTPEEVKQEIRQSITLCPPGPHAVLLVIDSNSSFTGKHKTEVEEHLHLISDSIWRHTIVLFTRGDLLEYTTIDQHIETEGQNLKWLIEKCGNRYHIFNNKSTADESQVTELLRKIDKMVSENRGQSFIMRSTAREMTRQSSLDVVRECLDEIWKEREEEIVQRVLGESFNSSEGDFNVFQHLSGSYKRVMDWLTLAHPPDSEQSVENSSDDLPLGTEALHFQRPRQPPTDSLQDGLLEQRTDRSAKCTVS